MTSPSCETLAAICRAWLPEGGIRLEPLGGAGFSGSSLSLVAGPSGRCVLKAFPPGTRPDRAGWVHGLMRHLAGRGVGTVAAPLATTAGDSLARDGEGRLWELLPFVPGSAVADPDAGQMAAALTALARLHAVAAAYPACLPDRGPSPGIKRRIEQAGRMLGQPWAALPRDPRPDETLLAGAVASRVPAAAAAIESPEHRRLLAALASAAARPLPRQAVLRDIWSDHVLFALPGKTRVAGIIDFHAADRDTPATDYARLLGSWLAPPAGEARDRWRAGLAAAAAAAGSGKACPLPLVGFLAASGVVFGLDNWFRWILVEERQFAAPLAVLKRVDRLVAMLPEALAALAETLENPGLTLKNCSL